MEKRSINIPFSGFYESSHDHEIENAINSYFDREGDGGNHTPENFFFSFKHYGDIQREYVALFTSEFSDWFEGETGLPLTLEYETMESPKFYNFSTDRIFALAPLEQIQAIYDATPKDVLEKEIEDNCTSYDGFHSHYSNVLSEWEEKPIEDWDHNELRILIQACLKATGRMQRGWEFDVMETALCNGRIDSIVYPYLIQWEAENPYEADTGLRIKEFFDIPDDEFDKLSEAEKDELNTKYKVAQPCDKTPDLFNGI